MSLTLSPDQATACDQIREYVTTGVNPCSKNNRYMTFGGYAGTGKSTILAKLMKEFANEAWAMAFTGKACAVLRKKGVTANTIHSSIYTCITKPGQKPVFVRKTDIPCEMIFVDESSMISKGLYDDILSYNIPVVFIGDHGQLEPVGENPNLMLKPDTRLEKIHRQAEGNPIITYAHHIRHHGDMGDFDSPDPTRLVIDTADNWMNHVTPTTQIITAFNGVRVAANLAMRDALDYPKDHPVTGDRVICLKNDKTLGIYNGQQGDIISCDAQPGDLCWCATVRFGEFTIPVPVRMIPAQFNSEKTIPWDPSQKDMQYFDYAYAVTCHKAQGSEYDDVLVVEQPSRLWDRARWGYTAATRAARKLTFCYED